MIFSEADRAIYVCPVTSRRYDPLAVKRRITVESGGRFSALCSDVRSDDPVVRAKGETELTRVARAALGLPAINPSDGSGICDADVYTALVSFTRWLSGKGEREQNSRTSAPCMGCPQD